MPALDATNKGTTANSYATVAEANTILDKRLYATSWTGAGTTPDADGYTVTSAGASAGASSVPVEDGTGTFTSGSSIKFSNDATTVYAVSSALTGDGSLSITPVLVVALSGSETVTRDSAFEKEKALMWSTTLLDELMVWYGNRTTLTQKLDWPRSGVYDAEGTLYDYDLTPDLLKTAQAELALSLLESNRFKAPESIGQGVSEVQAGPLKVKVDPTSVEAVIPDNVLAILGPLGYLEPGAQGQTTVLPVERS